LRIVDRRTRQQLGAKAQAKAQAQAEQKAFENTQQRFVPIQDLIKK
jgi:hypothetical protein